MLERFREWAYPLNPMNLREKLHDNVSLKHRIQTMLPLTFITLLRGYGMWTTGFFIPFMIAPELFRPLFGPPMKKMLPYEDEAVTTSNETS